MNVEQTKDGRFTITGSAELMQDVARAMHMLATVESDLARQTWTDRNRAYNHTLQAQRARNLAQLVEDAQR